MDCPNCGTYNPDERETCWRCNTVLPRPEPKKKKNPQKSAQTMLYVLIAVFALFTVLRMCGLQVPGLQTPAETEPSGYLLPKALLGSILAFLGVL